MSNLAGYISSFLVSLGMAAGFIIGGVIFAFLISYGLSLFLRRYRGLMSEDKKRAYPSKGRPLMPFRAHPKKAVEIETIN